MRLRMHRSYSVRAMGSVPRSRPGPLVVLWRWRYEVAAAAGLPLLLAGLAGVVGVPWVVFGAILAALVLVAWPGARAASWARVRCVMTAHRVRTGLVEAVVVNMRGKIPMVLWAAPAPYGECVWLWCRAGTTAREIRDGREILAATCWARDVRVRPHPRHPHLVLLEVVRQGGQGPSLPVPAPRPALDERPVAASEIAPG